MIRLSLLTIALFSSITANAAYIMRIPIDANIVFVKPQTDESMCQASSRYIKDYAKSINVDLNVGAGYSGNICNVDIYDIGSFANVGQLKNIGNYIQSLQAGSYTMSSVVYGFPNGGGQALLFNGGNYADFLWSQR